MPTKQQQRQQRRLTKRRPKYLDRAAARKRATTLGSVSPEKGKALASHQQLWCAVTRAIQHLNEYEGFKLEGITQATSAWAAMKRLRKTDDDSLLPSTYDMTAWTVKTIEEIVPVLFKDQPLVDVFQDQKNIIKICQELHSRLGKQWQRKMSFTCLIGPDGTNEDIINALNNQGLGGGTVKLMSTWLNLVLRAALAQAFAPKTLAPMLSDPSYWHKQQARLANAQQYRAAPAA